MVLSGNPSPLRKLTDRKGGPGRPDCAEARATLTGHTGSSLREASKGSISRLRNHRLISRAQPCAHTRHPHKYLGVSNHTALSSLQLSELFSPLTASCHETKKRSKKKKQRTNHTP
eukprot:m.6238 g.6238  ORF g.6238 m.6238 type:complete len:116 (-) comp3813_c0_seq1:9-356(-)